MQSKSYGWYITALIVVLIGGGAIALKGAGNVGSHRLPLQIVAAENFWGSLVSQLGGNKVSVTSVVSDPNADPHEYESNTSTARQIATADYVVINGDGYDDWANKLVGASPNSKRQVLNVANLLGVPSGSNPHFWYNPSYVKQVMARMEADLIRLDPKDKTYFEQRYSQVVASLSPYLDQISYIKQHYAGVKVATTEDIFVYLAQAAGLNVISPPSFIQAVAEGNDPPASSVVEFQQQLNDHQAALLVYNKQTVTPLTSNIVNLARENHIPVVGVTETIQPPRAPYQDWMNNQITDIKNALNQAKGN